MRQHLFEFLDQAWLPGTIRTGMTRFLAASYQSSPLPGLWAAQIAEVLRASGQREIVDLGSGASGPMHLVATELRQLGLEPRITLTDLYPIAAPQNSGEMLSYWPQSVDARSVPPTLTGLRTLFAAFHHFKAADAAAILEDAFHSRRAICIFEATARTPASIAFSLLIPLLVLLTTPSIRPISLAQIILTYLIPVLPLFIFWDGFVSQLRTYSPVEMLAMTVPLSASDYTWSAGEIVMPGLPLRLPYLCGCPLP